MARHQAVTVSHHRVTTNPHRVTTKPHKVTANPKGVIVSPKAASVKVRIPSQAMEEHKGRTTLSRGIKEDLAMTLALEAWVGVSNRRPCRPRPRSLLRRRLQHYMIHLLP